MAHEMTASDQMYSVRQAPWHLGRGTNVLMLDTAPETRADRMRAAGHDWEVVEEELYRVRLDADGVGYVPIDGWKLLNRGDTGANLHVARDTYAVVQNETGHEIYEALAKGAPLDDGTGGSVNGGRRCYLTARIDEPATVNGDTSPVYPQIVVTWTHDGSGAVTARRTTFRVVCANTLNASELEAKRSGREFTFRHTRNVSARIEEAKTILAGARQDTAAFVELANELAAIVVSDETREAFVQRFIPAPATDLVISDRVLDNITAARNKVRALLTPGSATIPEVHQHTAYGLVTAGVEYLDHLRGARSADTYLGRTLLRDEPLKSRLVPMVRDLVKSAV